MASRPEFPGLDRIPWDLVLDYLLEERTDLGETTSAGVESLGRLATCNSALRACLHDRIRASFRAVLSGASQRSHGASREHSRVNDSMDREQVILLSPPRAP